MAREKSINCFYTRALFLVLILFSTPIFASDSTPQPHFNKVLIIIFENMSAAEIIYTKNFQRLYQLAKRKKSDEYGNGYAYVDNFYNNHNGGAGTLKNASHPSLPNYIALTSGSTQRLKSDDEVNLNVDNLSLVFAGKKTWRVYAEDLPSSPCFKGAEFIQDSRNYVRKHEPFISYVNVQKNKKLCANIVSEPSRASDGPSRFEADVAQKKLADFSLYIPNQINDGHDGDLKTRQKNANAFLGKMLGCDATSKPIPFANAPLQQFINDGGLVIITFDETSNADPRMYFIMAGKMLKSGIYTPTCYPAVDQQVKLDANGAYAPDACNYYNVLKLLEAEWQLRSLKNGSAGYGYAYPLDNGLSRFWKP